MTQRKISVNAPFKPSPQQSPNPPPGGFLPKRPVEKIEDAKITRFGEARMKSPAPPSTPPHQQRQFSPPFNGGSRINGHGHSGSEVDFLSLLEKEEADFAEQIKKQKTFLQGVFNDKEELAQLCVTQSNKLSKLENERMEWQRKIIEAEREKRDYLERLDGEQQAHRQSVKKFEKLKRDLDKTQTDYALLAKERNDSVSQLSKEMKEIERLEAERVELFSRIDSYERSKTERKENIEVTKGMGDLNLKLKMELGQVKIENEKLSKEKQDLNNKLVTTKSTLRESETELKSSKTKLSEASESCTNLKNLLEATQIELKKSKDAELEAKMEVTKAMKEAVTSSDGTSKLSKDLDRIDKERKEGLQKIQTIHSEIKDLKAKLSEYESNKAKEIKKLQDSLTESLKSNKK